MCDDCWGHLQRAAPIHQRFAAGQSVTWAAAVDHYDGRLKDIVHALKYDRRRSIAPPLAALMRTSGAFLLRDADGVVPVPLHPRREYGRGFNQAHDLARHLGLPVLPLLKRIVHTTSQIELPAHERHRNVRDAFALNDKPQGLSILVLVDDVSTTGATLDACASVLKAAGVKEVRALTAARVVTGRHP